MNVSNFSSFMNNNERKQLITSANQEEIKMKLRGTL